MTLWPEKWLKLQNGESACFRDYRDEPKVSSEKYKRKRVANARLYCRDVGGGVFPDREKVLIRRLGLSSISLHRIGASKVQARKHARGELTVSALFSANFLNSAAAAPPSCASGPRGHADTPDTGTPRFPVKDPEHPTHEQLSAAESPQPFPAPYGLSAPRLGSPAANRNSSSYSEDFVSATRPSSSARAPYRPFAPAPEPQERVRFAPSTPPALPLPGDAPQRDCRTPPRESQHSTPTSPLSLFSRGDFHYGLVDDEKK